MKLDVRIPISPEPHFFRSVEYVVKSFHACGGATAEARFVISVGADCEPYDLYEANPWSRGRVEWRWVDREEFRKHSYSATGLDRLHAPTDADVVLILDADTLLVRPIDDLLQSLVLTPVVAGVISHVPPFWQTKLTWQNVFNAVGWNQPTGQFAHTGFGALYDDPVSRWAPAYYNFGVVFVPGSVLAPLTAEYERQLPRALGAPIHKVYYAQLAFTFAIYQLGLPHVALDFRFNFANAAWADRKHLLDLADVRIIHYLDERVITRRGEWGSEQAFQAFIDRRDLTGSNEILRSCVEHLQKLPWPTAGAGAGSNLGDPSR